MLKRIRRLLGLEDSGPQPDRAGADDVRVAACALLIEAATVDGDFSGDEREAVLSALREDLGVPENEIRALMDRARDELEESIDLWRFTNLVNRHSTIEEKEHILELVWRVVLSDRRIEKHEDYLARKLGELLRLDHNQMIAAKLRAQQQVRSSPSE
jgi:uncharacterized tellurite resistance protein B-like protein